MQYVLFSKNRLSDYFHNILISGSLADREYHVFIQILFFFQWQVWDYITLTDNLSKFISHIYHSLTSYRGCPQKYNNFVYEISQSQIAKPTFDVLLTISPFYFIQCCFGLLKFCDLNVVSRYFKTNNSDNIFHLEVAHFIFTPVNIIFHFVGFRW